MTPRFTRATVSPPFYDSMVGKLIVHAQTRAEAIRKMNAALCETVIDGIDNNRELQIELISNPLSATEATRRISSTGT